MGLKTVRIIIALILTAALLAAVSGCRNEYTYERNTIVPEIPDVTAAPTPEAVPSGGTLSVAVSGSGDSINPLSSFSEDLLNIRQFFFEPLIALGESMMPEPVLASGWTSRDALSWTVTIRDGVRFHDGTLLTSDDVKATIDALKKTDGPFSACVSNIKSAEAKVNSVEIILSKADGLLPWKLFFPILKAGETGSAYPSGTGPFSVSGADRSVYGSVRFGRFEQYRDGRTNIDALELRFFRDASKKAVSGCDIVLLEGDAAIKYGSQLGYGVRRFEDNSLICIVPYMYTGEKITYEIDAKNKIEQLPTKRAEALSINMRKALSEIVDRDRAIERTVSGWGKPYDMPVFDNCIFRKNSEFSTPSISAVEKLLEAEGYKHEGGNTNWFKADDVEKKKPLTVNFLVSSDDVELIHACDSAVSKLKSIGIKTTVKVASGGEYTALLLSGEFDYTFLRLNMGFAPDMDGAFAKGSIFNYNGYDSSWITERLSKAAGRWPGGADAAEACAQFASEYSVELDAVYARLQREIPFIGLYVRTNCLLFSERLHWGDSAGVESWNLFPDIGSWYLV